MGATLGNCNQLMVLCPIQGNTFCQPPDGGSWQLAMAPKGQQCCCQGSAVTFFEGFIQNSQLLFKLPTPEPFSNCFFKPYLALPWNATLLEGVLFQEKPFFKDIPFSRESFLQWQGNPFSRLVTRKASVSVYLVMVSKSTFKPQAAECQCIHCSKLWCNMLLSSNTGSSTSSSSKPFFLHVSALCPGRLLLPTVHTRADVNLVQGAQLYMYFPKPQGLP